jgi:hypothetical protein
MTTAPPNQPTKTGVGDDAGRAAGHQAGLVL